MHFIDEEIGTYNSKVTGCIAEKWQRQFTYKIEPTLWNGWISGDKYILYISGYL